MLDFTWDLQLFASVDVSAMASTAGASGTAYYMSDGTINTSGGAGSGTTLVATYTGSTLKIAGNNTIVDNQSTYTVVVGTAGTVGTAAATGIGATSDGYFVMNGIQFTVGSTSGIGMSNGGIKSVSGTTTIGDFDSGESFGVYEFTTANKQQLVFSSGTVTAKNATGTFGNVDGVYTYEATDHGSAGQQIDLYSSQTTGITGHAWSLKGSSYADTLKGSATGADTLYGGAGDDTVNLYGANSFAYGEAGKDTIVAAGTFSYIDGGEGADSLAATSANSTVIGGAGNDLVTIRGGLGYVDAGDGDDTVVVDAAGDAGYTVIGGDGNDKISSGGALINSSVVGGAGDDTLDFAATASGTGNTLEGGEGNDVILSTRASNVLVGGAGADVFAAYTGMAANITDYSLADGDMISIDSASATNLAARATTLYADDSIKADGTAIKGNATVNASESGYYAVQFTDANQNKQYVGWVKSDAASTIDLSSVTSSVILMGTQNGETGDLFVGGSKADTIVAGTNDSVYGGLGDDLIDLAGTKAHAFVGVGTNSGKDTVTNFVGGFGDENNSVYLVEGSASDVTMRFDNTTNATVKAGSGQLYLQNLTKNNTTGAAEILVNGAKVAVAGSGQTINASAADYADFYRGTDKASALSFAKVDDAVAVDLSDTAKYQGIVTVTGGTGSSTLMGGTAKETLIAGSGGSASLWGGADNKADSLVGNAKSEDTFVFTTGSGKDSVSSFAAYTADGTNDLLNTFGSAITGINRTAGNTVKVTVGGSSSDVLTLQTTSSNGANDMIQWTDGTNSGIAKIGYSAQANSFTYDEAATLYVGGSKSDALRLTDSDSHNIWLDGSQGTVYSSIDVIDAASASGGNQLAGDSSSQSIAAGRGGDSLWGGAGTAADTLKGGSGSDVFFYGYGNGKDVMQNVSGDDLVTLFDISLSQLKSAEISTTGSIVVTADNGDVLTVNKASGATGATFQLADGSKWTATYSTQEWSQG